MPARVSTSFLLYFAVVLASPSATAVELRVGERLDLPAAGLIDRDARVSPREAARIAQRQNGGGRVLAVEHNDSGYRVKLLKDGDVRIVYVPGE